MDILIFRVLDTTSEPDFVDYFSYLVKVNGELHPTTTWEGAKKLYQYIIESAALI